MNINKKLSKLLMYPENINLEPIKIKFNITTLDSIISLLYKDTKLLTRKTQNNILNLFSNLDLNEYDNNPELLDRIWIIKNTIIGRVKEGIESSNENLIQYCRDREDCNEHIESILSAIPVSNLTYQECKILINKLEDALKYGYCTTFIPLLSELMEYIQTASFGEYKSVQENLFQISNLFINIKRQIGSKGSDETFSLYEEAFDNAIDEVVTKLSDRNRIFVTGIKRLNTLLAPGYMSKRLYTYLAFPGKGKSMILLKSAIDIKKYNKGVKTKDPDKRPAVLFLTLENDIPETVERIYNMTVDSDDIRNYTPKQVIKKMRKTGHLEITEEDNIDIIIKEYKNRELDTNDLYAIINDMADEGIEVIALVIDYMKRLRPAEKAGSEKEELKNISNELKDIAKFFDIPVITAQQLNRSGAAVIDAALQANKEDVTRLVGSDSIAGAWEIQENSDMTIIINPETKADTGEQYLTFKMLKRRYRSHETDEKLKKLEYFNHPFEPGNGIRLIDDIYLNKSLSLTSLSSQFVATEEKRGKKNAIDRDEKKKNKHKEDIDDFSVFDQSSSIQF